MMPVWRASACFRADSHTWNSVLPYRLRLFYGRAQRRGIPRFCAAQHSSAVDECATTYAWDEDRKRLRIRTPEKAIVEILKAKGSLSDLALQDRSATELRFFNCSTVAGVQQRENHPHERTTHFEPIIQPQKNWKPEVVHLLQTV